MEILAALYYVFGLFFFVLNLFELIGSTSLRPSSIQRTKQGKIKDKDLGLFMVSCSTYALYFGWILLGLLTAKWLFFILFMVLTAVLHVVESGVESYINSTLSMVISKTETFLEAVFILFIILNHFHFNLLITPEDLQMLF